MVVLDRFFPTIAEAVAKTDVKNIVLQSLTEDGVRAYIKYFIGSWDNGVHDIVVTETGKNNVLAHLILRQNKNNSMTQAEYERNAIQSIHVRLLQEDFEEYSVPDISYRIWDSFPTNMESGKVDGKKMSQTTSDVYVVQEDGSFEKVDVLHCGGSKLQRAAYDTQ